MSILTFPTQSLTQAPKGDIIRLIFAGHALAKLVSDDHLCLCGNLTGPADRPENHVNQLCPVAVFYAALDEMAVHCG